LLKLYTFAATLGLAAAWGTVAAASELCPHTDAAISMRDSVLLGGPDKSGEAVVHAAIGAAVITTRPRPDETIGYLYLDDHGWLFAQLRAHAGPDARRWFTNNTTPALGRLLALKSGARLPPWLAIKPCPSP